MNNQQITNQLALMSHSQLLTLREQIDQCLTQQSQTNTRKSNTSRQLYYRYKIRCGTVTPKSMKEQLLQGDGNCMLGISLGSPKSQADRFESNIRWISQNFKHCTLVMADSIYRYTFILRQAQSLERARASALTMAEQFIIDNQAIIDRYTDNCEFQWLKMSQIEHYQHFHQYLETYQNLYRINSSFKQQIDHEAEKYLSGLAQSEQLLAPQVINKNIELSAQYFIEESAIFTCLSENGHHNLLYPGTIKPLQILSEGKIPGTPEAMKKLVLVRLNQSTQAPYFHPPGPFQTQQTYPPAYYSSILNNLNDNDWSHILAHTKERNFQAGDIIIKAGDGNRVLVIVLKGNVEVLTGDWSTGQVQQTLICGPISMFGERSFLSGSSATKTLAALTDGQALILTPGALQKLMKKAPTTALLLINDIAMVLANRCSV